VLHEGVDLGHQFLDAAEGAAADGALGEQSEPPFHLVQPGGIGGRVVQVETGMLRQPGTNLGMLVRGVVIDDEVEIEFCGHAGVQVAQKGEELLVPVARLAFGKHGTGGNVERGKQCAVTHLIMSHAFHIPQSYRQHPVGYG